MEVIKRYENRKLYSTMLKKYVTLSYIIDLVKTDQKFQVIDNKTKADITKTTKHQTVTKLELSSSTLDALIKGA